MRTCLLCKTRYPDGIEVCPIDGGAVLAGGGLERTAALETGNAQARVLAGINAAPAKEPAHDPPTSYPRPPSSGALQREATRDLPAVGFSGSADLPLSGGRRDSSHTSGAATPTIPPEERIGTLLGSYRIRSILGKGGMGCVYRAEHVLLGRDVALKLLREDYGKRRDAVARFFQEARAVNRIRHRNIVDVTDLIELPDGTAFIIMELLDGYNLGRLTRGPAPIPIDRGLRILEQLCDGLAAAHSVGIVHRDLKPDNIVIVEQPEGGDLVKILDFGVAKLIDNNSEAGSLTVAGSVIGTPAYMSPEQAGGLQVDPRSDVYSLGAIMYEMFAKQPPFKGKNFGDYVRMHLNDVPVPPSQTPAGGGLDPRIEHVIMRCLEKSPNARYQSAVQLHDDLVALSRELFAARDEPSFVPTLLHSSGRWSAPPAPVAIPPPPAEWSAAPPEEMSGVSIDGRFDSSETDAPTAADVDRRIRMSAPMSVAYPPADSQPVYGPAQAYDVWSSSPPHQIGSGTPNPISYGPPTPLPMPYNPAFAPPAPVPDLRASSRRRNLAIALAGVAVLVLVVVSTRSSGGDGVQVTAVKSGEKSDRKPTPPTPSPTAGAIAVPTVDPTAPKVEAPASKAYSLDASGSMGSSIGTVEAGDVAGEAPRTPPGKKKKNDRAERAARERTEREAREREERAVREERLPRPTLIEFQVRVSSRPPAELYVAGSTKALCMTPCNVTIDPADGGSRTRRTFVLRRKGYKDETLRVDVAKPPKELHLALSRLPREGE